MLHIRSATVADIPLLVPLIEQYWEFESIPDFNADRVASLLRGALADSARARAWLAESGTQPCGYLLTVQMFSLEFGGTVAEIDEFFVIPRARAQGIGRALLEAVERTLRAEGCRGIQLQLGVENAAAREFYRAHGYGERAGFELYHKSL